MPPQFQNQLIKNIVISGGNTQIKGFKERLMHDIEKERRFPNFVNQV